MWFQQRICDYLKVLPSHTFCLCAADIYNQFYQQTSKTIFQCIKTIWYGGGGGREVVYFMKTENRVYFNLLNPLIAITKFYLEIVRLIFHYVIVCFLMSGFEYFEEQYCHHLKPTWCHITCIVLCMITWWNQEQNFTAVDFSVKIWIVFKLLW